MSGSAAVHLQKKSPGQPKPTYRHWTCYLNTQQAEYRNTCCMYTSLLFYTLSANLGFFVPLAPITIKVMECREMYCIVYYLGRY